MLALGLLDRKISSVAVIFLSPSCGDVMKLQIEVGHDKATITKAVFKVDNIF